MRHLFLTMTILAASGSGIAVSHAIPEARRQAGLTAVQSDSACAAHVPGASLEDYLGACARLIAELTDTIEKCGRLANLPLSQQQRYDAEQFCTASNLRLLRVQLAAARNDRAYFLIQRSGTDNYLAALVELNRAMQLMQNRYWLAQRNRAVVHMLLGNHKDAQADFRSLLTALEESLLSTTTGKEAEPSVFIRPTTHAEMRLGYGLALLGLCNHLAAQDELTTTEALTRGPIGTNNEIYAFALYGQGLAWKIKAQVERNSLIGNSRAGAAERARINQYADSLQVTAQRKMDAADALLPGVASLVRQRFHIEQDVVLARCRSGRAVGS